jgi:hypothetical protein
MRSFLLAIASFVALSLTAQTVPDADAHRRTSLRLLPQISGGRKGVAMALTF